MTTEPTPAVETSGTYQLLVPNDMFNVLAPEDPDEARTVFADLFSEMFPSIDRGDLEDLVDGILEWRNRLLSDGIIFHGLVAMPAGFEYERHVFGAAHWHVFAGITEVPVHEEIDSGAIVARLFDQQFDGDAYTESFPTEMGWGAGLITEMPVPRPAAVETVPPPGMPTSFAVAAAVSGVHGQDRGLFVIGMAVDIEQKHEMAAVVALIAGKSIIDVTQTPEAP